MKYNYRLSINSKIINNFDIKFFAFFFFFSIHLINIILEFKIKFSNLNFILRRLKINIFLKFSFFVINVENKFHIILIFLIYIFNFFFVRFHFENVNIIIRYFLNDLINVLNEIKRFIIDSD